MSSRIQTPGVAKHHLSVVNIANFRVHFLHAWVELCEEFSIQDDEHETFYDWCVTEGFARYVEAKFQVQVAGRYRHEIYDMAQEAGQLLYFLMNQFESLFQTGTLNLLGAVTVKTLVAGEILTIAIGVNPNV